VSIFSLACAYSSFPSLQRKTHLSPKTTVKRPPNTASLSSDVEDEKVSWLVVSIVRFNDTLYSYVYFSFCTENTTFLNATERGR
jgi:hypothetical protein